MPQNIKIGNIQINPAELPNQVKSFQVSKVQEGNLKITTSTINYADLSEQEKITFDNFVGLVTSKTI